MVVFVCDSDYMFVLFGGCWHGEGCAVYYVTVMAGCCFGKKWAKGCAGAQTKEGGNRWVLVVWFELCCVVSDKRYEVLNKGILFEWKESEDSCFIFGDVIVWVIRVLLRISCARRLLKLDRWCLRVSMMVMMIWVLCRCSWIRGSMLGCCVVHMVEVWLWRDEGMVLWIWCSGFTSGVRYWWWGIEIEV